MDSHSVTVNNNGLSLTSVPLEVLLQITSNLTTTEYGNLRRTCKHIEETLFNAFSREFFTKRQFFFTEFSLQALVSISKSRMSSCLSHVIFGLERPCLNYFIAQSPAMLLDKDCIRNNRIREEYINHITLLNTGHGVEMLAEAFSNLSKLETIGIRDFYSRSRNRDYPENEWKSYGVQTYQVEINSPLEWPQRTHNAPIVPLSFLNQANYLSGVFLNLLRALGKAGSQPKHFEVILRKSSIHDNAFHIPKYLESTVQPVLANLQTLLLDLDSEFPAAYVEVDNATALCPNYLLRIFLSKLSALEHLRLNFRFYRGDETSNLLSWLAKPVSAVTSNTETGTGLLQSPQSINFTKLRQLEIGMITIEPHVLLAIIQKHQATLRTISLHKVSLLQTGSTESGDNLWANFYSQLSKLNLKLSAINMSLLSQEQPQKQHRQHIAFKDSPNPKSRKWGGTDVKSGLRDFVANVTVIGLDQDSDSSLVSYIGASDEGDSNDSMHDIDDDESEDDNEEL